MSGLKPTRRSGRVLVVALREIIKDSRSSPRTRLSACRLLAICEGIVPPRKKHEKAASQLPCKSANSSNLSHLVAVAESRQ